MYIELPFGIIIATRNNVVFTDPNLLQLKLYQDRVKELTEDVNLLENELTVRGRTVTEKSAEIGRLEAANSWYQDQLDELQREILVRKQDTASLESRLARAESRDSDVATPGDISQGLTGVNDMDAIDLLNQKLAAAGLIDPNAKMLDPRASMLTDWGSQQNASTRMAQAIESSWDIPIPASPPAGGSAHDPARDEDLDY